jgi:hypothetical protein
MTTEQIVLSIGLSLSVPKEELSGFKNMKLLLVPTEKQGTSESPNLFRKY